MPRPRKMTHRNQPHSSPPNTGAPQQQQPAKAAAVRNHCCKPLRHRNLAHTHTHTSCQQQAHSNQKLALALCTQAHTKRSRYIAAAIRLCVICCNVHSCSKVKKKTPGFQQCMRQHQRLPRPTHDKSLPAAAHHPQQLWPDHPSHTHPAQPAG